MRRILTIIRVKSNFILCFHTLADSLGVFARGYEQKSSPLRESLSLVVLCNRREEKD